MYTQILFYNTIINDIQCILFIVCTHLSLPMVNYHEDKHTFFYHTDLPYLKVSFVS